MVRAPHLISVPREIKGFVERGVSFDTLLVMRKTS